MFRCIMTALVSMILLSLSGLLKMQSIQTDVLIYRVEDYGAPNLLMMWNPQTGDHTSLPNPLNIDMRDRLDVSANGYIAYSSNQTGNQDIFVMDAFAEDSAPIKVSHSPNISEQLMAWSYDGRYLAFTEMDSHDIHVWDSGVATHITLDNLYARGLAGHRNPWSPDGRYLAVMDSNLVYVWDGDSLLNITPDDLVTDVSRYGFAWSNDNRLALTVWYRNYGFLETGHSEVVLWDGQTTKKLQNPTAYEEFGAVSWSVDGRLALISREGNEGDIFVWDGASVDAEGRPDVDTLANVAPELTSAWTSPIWTSDGRLSFSEDTAEDSHTQIYAWDGETVTNISQNSGYHSVNGRWTNDGRWAFQTIYPSEQLVYARDANNESLLVTEGRSPVWSSDGLLAFCKSTTLLVWDGQEIIEVASSGIAVEATWLGGAYNLTCSDG